MLEGKAPLAFSAVSIEDRDRDRADSSSILEEKERELLREKMQKEELLKKISELQDTIGEGPRQEAVNPKELEEYKRLKEKLRVRRKKEEELRKISEQKEKQLLNIEENYKSLAEEVEAMRARFGTVKKKYV
jgi:hypothetical protein